MKELWTANPFCLTNRPFAEMGYSSGGLNIAPERLLLATRRPFTHHPIASGAPSFDPLRATRRRATNHLQHTAQHLATPASHLPSFCAAPGGPLHSIRHLAANHPPSRRKPSSGPCAASVGSLQAICPPVHRAMPGDPLQAIRHRTAQHPPTPARHPLAPCRHLPARTDALNDPQNKPSTQAGALNPPQKHVLHN